MVVAILQHTPPWVWVLLAFLVWRGIQARRPADVTPARLLPIPIVFTAWGLYELFFAHAATVASVALWLGGLAAGCVVGYAMLRRAPITADRARGILHRPGDPTVLLTVVTAFVIKYAFAVAHVIAPDTMAQTAWHVAEVLVGGALAGIFVGKFVRYLRVYLA